jgi:putative phosphoesterase
MPTLGIISDTHIPDRARSLDRLALDIFDQAGVAEILHAGDVSAPRVLSQLGEIAPVCAVRGNRDWVSLANLPYHQVRSYEGVQVGLTHGHGRWWEYMVDRVDYIVRGYRLEMFEPRLLEAFQQANVIVFGHTHRPLLHWADSVLLINPGSPHFPDLKTSPPSVGLLNIGAGGEVNGEIVYLE